MSTHNYQVVTLHNNELLYWTGKAPWHSGREFAMSMSKCAALELIADATMSAAPLLVRAAAIRADCPPPDLLDERLHKYPDLSSLRKAASDLRWACADFCEHGGTRDQKRRMDEASERVVDEALLLVPEGDTWSEMTLAAEYANYGAMHSIAKRCGLELSGCEAPEQLWNMVGRHLGIFK